MSISQQMVKWNVERRVYVKILVKCAFKITQSPHGVLSLGALVSALVSSLLPDGALVKPQAKKGAWISTLNAVGIFPKSEEKKGE